MSSRKRSYTKRTWTTSKGIERTAFVVDFVDASGKRCRRQFDSKREADTFRVGTEGQLRAGTFRGDAAKITAKEATELYLEYCEGRHQRCERMTRHNLNVYRGIARKHVLHPEHGIGGITLAQLSASQITKFKDRLRTAGVSVSITRKSVAFVKRTLDHAISQDFVATNAAVGVKVIGRRDEATKKVTPPTKEHVKALLGAADSDLRTKMLVAAATGVRAGELWALRWRHIDFGACEVTVETRVDAYGDEDTTKTAAGVRVVPLGTATVQTLREWRVKSKFKKADDLVFPNTQGGYTSHHNFLRRRYNALFGSMATKCQEDDSKAPAPPKTNWHAFRHYAISTWIEAGLKPKTVQTFAGHSSLSVTMDRYGHLFPSDDHKTAMDSIADALGA